VSPRSLIQVALLASALGLATSGCGSSCGDGKGSNGVQIAFDQPFPSPYEGTIAIAGRSVALAGCPMTGETEGLSVSCRADALSVSGPDLPGNATLVIVTLLTADRFGARNAVVPLGPSSCAACGVCERHGVTTLGLVAPDRGPALTFNPAQLDFGSVPVGQQFVNPTPLMLENRASFATGPLTLSISGTDFVVATTTCTALGAGMACAVQIGFRPGYPGLQDGLLTARTANLVATARLTGVGLPRPDAAAGD
jgi:hypothetical protein